MLNVIMPVLGACVFLPAERWEEAHRHREALLEYITNCSGAGTLLDYRRYRDYDADKNVDRYLNQPEVKVSHVGANPIAASPVGAFLLQPFQPGAVLPALQRNVMTDGSCALCSQIKEVSKFYSARAVTAAKAGQKARHIECELSTVDF